MGQAGVTGAAVEYRSIADTPTPSVVHQVSLAGEPLLSEPQLRKWLRLLKQPDRLDEPLARALLERHARLPHPLTAHDIGLALVTLIREKIDELDPGSDAGRDSRLPYLVLHISFVRGTKVFQGANQLSISERQMARERRRAIELLRDKLETPDRAFALEGAPDVGSAYAGRPELSSLAAALEAARCVMLVGSAGVGKTAFSAALANSQGTRSVFWRSVRRGVNDSLSSLLVDLGHYLARESAVELNRYIYDSLPTFDPTIATRFAIGGLSARPRLLVFDDWQNIDGVHSSLPGFIDELALRIPSLRLLLVSRSYELLCRSIAAVVEIPASQSTP